MTNDFFIYTGRFIFLVLLQVVLLNHINFLGYINPYFYILFILILPVSLPSWQVIILGFLLGLSIDLFGDSGGMHAAACLVIAYFRPKLLRASYGISYDYQTVKFHDTSMKERVVFVISMTLIHHLVLFSLVFFNFSHLTLILKNTLYSSIFTIFLIMITASLFQRVKR
ncbi:MAG TPA: rod shape-determining protein MreD [Flavobacteriaceae bacterium]|nr:rod shape-determining protein MreD [Flavobacteriaceae bacterium]